MPFTKGKNKLMVAPRTRDHSVGGWYRITAGDDDEGGDAESSSGLVEYCSLSDRIVTPDSAIGFGVSSEAMMEAVNLRLDLRKEV